MPRVKAKERAYIEPLGLEMVEFGKAVPSLRFGRDSDWVPTMPPDFQPNEPIGLDFEYLPDERSVLGSRPFSYAVYSPTRKAGWYVPWGHLAGGNVDKDLAVRWLANNLVGRDVHGLNVKAEMHMVRNLGLDPRRMGTRPHDCAFPPTLLDENRLSGFSLEALAEEYLPPEERKVHPGLPPALFSLGHAGMIQERCVSDARLACRIHEVTRPQIEAEDLVRVNDLEDRGILAVVEAERNGALIDRPKLERWAQLIQNRVATAQENLGAISGLRNFNPNQTKHMEALFRHLGRAKPQEFDEGEKRWKESWSAAALEPLAYVNGKYEDGIQDQTIALALDIRGHLSLMSKYVSKYLNAIDSNNVLRYSLHQLRGTKEEGERNYGTVTGRFSCGGGAYNINIQQVMKAEDQLEQVVKDFVIRELFIAEPGKQVGASDASQIEFRLFSHAAAVFGYTGTALAYAQDPWIDFHLMVTQLMNPGVSDKQKLKALRKHMKHNNFGCIYGLGRPKLARKLGMGCTCPFDWDEVYWDDGRERRVRFFADNSNHEPQCKARLANDIMDEYQEKFPEAKFLLKKADEGAQRDGCTKTLLGRRRHFAPGDRTYTKGFSSWDQGSAADLFKLKMIELYEAQRVALRMFVHDEFVYDTDPDPEYKRVTEELLNSQSLKLRVPILWQTGYGANWRQANGQ